MLVLCLVLGGTGSALPTRVGSVKSEKGAGLRTMAGVLEWVHRFLKKVVML